MKVVLLAGGFGTRISEESLYKPKPMIDIGGKPILWHIMKSYSQYGYNDFIICLGYMGYYIKEYFANYFLHQSDVTIDLKNNNLEVHRNTSEPWKVTMIDTGLHTLTGGRLARVRKYLGDETFLMTYGDGVADVDIQKVVDFHKKNGKLATLVGVQPDGRFGQLSMSESGQVESFQEKPHGDGGWINGGFFVLEPQALDYVKNGDQTMWEREPLEAIARDGQLMVYRHHSFWKCMDTLRDKNQLEQLWTDGKAPWKVWE